MASYGCCQVWKNHTKPRKIPSCWSFHKPFPWVYKKKNELEIGLLFSIRHCTQVIQPSFLTCSGNHKTPLEVLALSVFITAPVSKSHEFPALLNLKMCTLQIIKWWKYTYILTEIKRKPKLHLKFYSKIVPIKSLGLMKSYIWKRQFTKHRSPS